METSVRCLWEELIDSPSPPRVVSQPNIVYSSMYLSTYLINTTHHFWEKNKKRMRTRNKPLHPPHIRPLSSYPCSSSSSSSSSSGISKNSIPSRVNKNPALPLPPWVPPADGAGWDDQPRRSKYHRTSSQAAPMCWKQVCAEVSSRLRSGLQRARSEFELIGQGQGQPACLHKEGRNTTGI